MGIKLVTLPASKGKTTWIVNQARKAAFELKTQPRIVLPSRQQVLDMETRLAKAGGVMGVEVGTIVDLASEVLDLGGVYPLLLSENVQNKILRSVLEELDLKYYQAISTKPGFIRSCLGIIRELKAGGISPKEFLDAAGHSQKGPRLIELGLIYSAYQEKLRNKGWADRAGLTWLAAEILGERPELCGDWDSVFLDGFDDLSPMQLQLISSLAERIEDFYLTLTGSTGSGRRELVHKRFIRLREMLMQGNVEDLQVEPVEEIGPAGPASLLEKRLFDNKDQGIGEIQGEIILAAVPDREAEVRTALRWIRYKILEEKIPLAETAILARNLEPYRGLISRIASEYKIPVRLQGGLPLAENPLIAVIIKLAKLIAEGKDGLVWYEVLSIWRSPYLNWSHITDRSETDYSRISHLADTKQLEEAACWGRVIQGYSHWEHTFQSLIEIQEEKQDQDHEGEGISVDLPRGKQAERLWEKFSNFIDLLTPPAELTSRESTIAWFESLLGGVEPDDPLPEGLGVVGEILAGPGDIAERDWKALAELNDIFKEMIKAERLLNSLPVTFSQFSNELEEIINQSSYQPQDWQENAILCAGCTEARGLIFQAAAVLGLAEGEFPGTIKEDPFIRDEERILLREGFNLPLRLSLDSAEGEYFYEALTRSTKYLMITRPRIADNGAAWQPSPYWEEVQRITQLDATVYTTRTIIPPRLAANLAELLQNSSWGGRIPTALKEQADERILARVQNLERSKEIILERSTREAHGSSLYDGNLKNREEVISDKYPVDHIWSASRLENYQTCPFNYFIGYVLGLEKPELPEEGLDSRQLGNIYHHILERLYQQVGKDYSVEDLLAGLHEAAELVFIDAPKKEGFRETAWWEHTQREILENVKLTLIQLEAIEPDYRFHAAEQRFGIGPDEEEPLVVEIPNKGVFQLRGFIDRVDINRQGEIRIVDYKTSGAFGFDNRAVREGKKLQLPLYALAAQERLNLGPVKDGFYFHLLAATPSSFKLSSYKEGPSRGPELAMKRAAEIGWQTVSAIKDGYFPPKPPDQGCPDYCPAVDFCWHYRPRRW
jgi:ATP-dependent helicase/DNAse subunit B